MKRVLAALFCLLAFTATAQAADGSWEKVKAEGKLTFGLDDAFPPMGYRTDEGKLIGFDIDAGNELGRRLGLKIVWQPTAWDGVIHSLYAKKFDAIWNGMTITKERQARVWFTKPYIMDGQVAVVRFDEKRFASYKDLGGATLGAQKGSSALNAVKKLPEAPKAVREYKENPKALLDLENRRLDAVVIDNVVGRDAIAKRIGKYKTLPGFISQEPFGVALRKEDASLQFKVQQTLDAMVADGTMGRISVKWFGEDITDPSRW